MTTRQFVSELDFKKSSHFSGKVYVASGNFRTSFRLTSSSNTSSSSCPHRRSSSVDHDALQSSFKKSHGYLTTQTERHIPRGSHFKAQRLWTIFLVSETSGSVQKQKKCWFNSCIFVVNESWSIQFLHYVQDVIDVFIKFVKADNLLEAFFEQTCWSFCCVSSVSEDVIDLLGCPAVSELLGVTITLRYCITNFGIALSVQAPEMPVQTRIAGSISQFQTSRIDIRTVHPRKSAESVSETRMWLTGSIRSGAGEDDESPRKLPGKCSSS